jgi:hypothetical protein
MRSSPKHPVSTFLAKFSKRSFNQAMSNAVGFPETGHGLRSEEVSKIREVLFGDELRDLRGLVERLGCEPKLAVTISGVIAESLKLSNEADHRRLAAALSPAVVGTVRREIANSREELVEALYPIAGQLVSAYVADGLKRLLDKSDSRLRSWFSLRRAWLRIRSFLSGVPYRKLLLYHLSGLRLEQVLLIKRGAGLVLDEWDSDAAKLEAARAISRKSMVAGMLAAINEFASEALAGESGALRTLDLGGSAMHLRATPAYILAVKCSGPASRLLERHIDLVLRKSLEAIPPQRVAEASSAWQGTAQTIARELEQLLLDAKIAPNGRRRRPVLAYAVLVMIALSVLAKVGDAVVQGVRASDVERRVADIIASAPSVIPSQTKIDVSDGGHMIRLSGTVPSRAVASELTNSIQQAVPDATVIQDFVIAVSPEVITQTLQQTEQVLTAIGSLGDKLLAFAAALPEAVASPAVAASTSLLKNSLAQIKKIATADATVPQAAAMDRVVLSALANVPNFEQGLDNKLKDLTHLSFDAGNPPLFAAPQPSANILEGMPVAWTEQGLRVSLFSSNSNSTSILGALGTGSGNSGPVASGLLGSPAGVQTGSATLGALEKEAGGAAGPAGIVTTTGAAVSPVTQGISNIIGQKR